MPRTEGLDALDRERAASLADEGGRSAAGAEGDEPALDERSGSGALWRAAAMGLAAALVIYLRRTR